MALASAKSVTVSSATTSDHIALESGEWGLHIKADGWGTAALQVGDGDVFVNAKDASGTEISLTANGCLVVAGGFSYRLNVSSYSQPITMKAIKSK